MIVSKAKIFSSIAWLIFASVAINDLFFLDIGGRAWTSYYFLALPALGLMIALGAFRATKIYILTYLFISILLIYVFAASMVGGIQNLVGIIPYAATPLIFLAFGHKLSSDQAVKFIVILLAANALSAAAYKLYFSFGYVGPGGLFRWVSINLVDYRIEASQVVRYGRPSGLFSNPNTLGAFGCFSLFALMALRASLQTWRRVGFFFALFAVGISGSRGSLVALAAGFACYSLQSLFSQQNISFGFRARNNWTTVGWGAILFGCLTYAGSELFSFERFSEILSFSANATPESFLERRQNWSVIFSFVQSHPLGTIIPPQLKLGVPTDNQYLEFLAWGGYPLALAFILYTLTLAFGSWIRAFARSPGPLIALVVSMAVNGISMTVLSSSAAFMFWFGIGLSISSASRAGLSIRNPLLTKVTR